MNQPCQLMNVDLTANRKGAVSRILDLICDNPGHIFHAATSVQPANHEDICHPSTGTQVLKSCGELFKIFRFLY